MLARAVVALDQRSDPGDDRVPGIVHGDAGWLFGGGASILNGPLNMMAFLYSLLGAVLLLLVVKLIRRAT